MYRSILITTIVGPLLFGCSTTNESCEDIETIMAQRRECSELRKRIQEADTIVLRTSLQDIYEKQCVSIRFYRDSFGDDQVCSVKRQGQKQQEK